MNKILLKPRNSRGEEVPFRDCTGKDGVEEDMVLCLFLMQSLCTSGPRVNEVEEDCWVYIYNVIVEFVELPQASLSFLLLKT